MFCPVWDMECPYDEELLSGEFCEACQEDRVDEFLG